MNSAKGLSSNAGAFSFLAAAAGFSAAGGVAGVSFASAIILG
jgi:hypothetical protein